MHSNTHSFGPLNRVAFFGNYLPRKCGLATFTTDLCTGFRRAHPDIDAFALAINDHSEGYDYPPEVRFQIDEQDSGAYQRAADYLNTSCTDLVCIQHEYGIYGGKDGDLILTFIKSLHMPSTVTLHTILENPTDSQKNIIVQMSGLCEKLIVMTRMGKHLLQRIYGIGEECILIIPHGIPDIDSSTKDICKQKMGVTGKKVLMTFGLISPGKGIENVLNALPGIIKKHPDVVYMLVGATHPNLLREQGESYRLGLSRLAKENGVSDNVIFFGRFMELDQLAEFISACDLYITPYLNRCQITSGTLAYCYGAGKVVVSTPYWHATELLANGKGFLVPFNDSNAITKAVNLALSDPDLMVKMQNQAYAEGRGMLWETVSNQYYDCFQNARKDFGEKLFLNVSTKGLFLPPESLPRINLRHVYEMTDSTGIIQHAKYKFPNYNEGYCTDDNARLLIVGTCMRDLGKGGVELDRVISTAVSFLNHAFDNHTGRFRNFMSYDRRWLEKTGSEDSHARTIWALGTAVGHTKDRGLLQICMNLFEMSLPVVKQFRSLRSWAFALIGIHEYFRRYHGDAFAIQLRSDLTEKLVNLFKSHAEPQWCWPEPIVAYANAKVAHALIQSGRWMEKPEVLHLGLKTLEWLWNIQLHEKGHFRPIGCHGWYQKSGAPNYYDQQPIEAGTTVSACIEAFFATGDNIWFDRATTVFQWYLGKNDLGQPLYDFATGGCCDALMIDEINLNQGAESTLSFHLALAEITQLHHNKKTLEVIGNDKALV